MDGRPASRGAAAPSSGWSSRRGGAAAVKRPTLLGVEDRQRACEHKDPQCTHDALGCAQPDLADKDAEQYTPDGSRQGSVDAVVRACDVEPPVDGHSYSVSHDRSDHGSRCGGCREKREAVPTPRASEETRRHGSCYRRSEAEQLAKSLPRWEE